MTLPVQKVSALFFDMNGTLRVTQPDEATVRAARRRLLELIGAEDAGEPFWTGLAARKQQYDAWAKEHLAQLSEAEIWTRWLLPDFPAEAICQAAPELSLAWGQLKGKKLPRAGAGETLKELKRRGYRLGVISNSFSTLDIPRSLEAYDWKGLFEAVVLSSALMVRKPAPQPFLEAAARLGVEPSRCAYVGNRINKDIVGCQRAGFGLGILLEEPGKGTPEKATKPLFPVIVIRSLDKLLEIFPEGT